MKCHVEGTLETDVWGDKHRIKNEKEQYTDWKDVELSGTFTGTWQLRYWSPEGNSGEKRNCLLLTATYDDAERDFMAYSCVLTFAYADATTLRIQGYYVKNPDGWINYQRGEAEPGFSSK